MKEEIKLISKLAETEVKLLKALYKDSYPDQEGLRKATRVNKSTCSKALKRLKQKNLIVDVKRGKYHQISINRSKKREIKRVLTIWEKFHNVLKDKTKVLVRVHDFEAHAGCYVPKSYPKETYNKHKPKNRFCINKEIKGVGSFTLTLSELDSKNNSIQIFVAPLYLVIPLDASQEEIDKLIYENNNRSIRFMIESLKKEGVIVGDSYHISEGSAAFVDDWLAQLSVRHHIKNRNIDESHYLIPEYELHAPNLAEKLHKIINLRERVFEGEISELELAKYIEKLTNTQQKW